MKKLILIIVVVSAMLVTAHAQNYTQVTATNITDTGGTKLIAGKLCFLGTDSNDVPINYQVGGGGQVITKEKCVDITNGAVTPFNIANPALTAPANIRYRVWSQDSKGKPVIVYSGVVLSGATFAFDDYVPSTSDLVDGQSVTRLTVQDITISGTCTGTGCGTGGGGTTPDATTLVKGKVKLAGDLGGTADLPTVPALSGKLDTTTAAATYEPKNANIQTHIASTANPHSTTAAQVGAVAVNGAITPGTNLKITYDAKGLVTAGAAAAFTDLSGSLAAGQMPGLTGDATSSAGTVATTVGKVNGTTFTTNAAADQVPVTTASAVTAWKTLPPCANPITSKLLYDQATHAFSCGTDQGGGGGMTNPMTALGDIIYGGAAGSPTRLAGNLTTTPLVYLSTGAAGAATAPTLGTIDYSLATIINKPVLPVTKTAVAGSPLLSYDSATGNYTQGPLTAVQVGAEASGAVATHAALTTGVHGAGVNSFVYSNDTRLTDARTPSAHVLDSATHTISGKTAGQVMRATSPTTFSFGAVDLANASAITGILPSGNGGTGNGFFAISGPITSTKTFTFPNASAIVLTDNALVTAAQGGTGNGFFAVSGPATTTKTFTFPNATATVLTTNAAVTVAQGGTGVGTLTGIVKGSGTSNFSVAAGADVVGLWASGTCSGYLKSDLTCSTPPVVAAGSDTQIQFNDGGTVFGADAGLTYNKTTDVLTVGGLTVSGTAGADTYTNIVAPGTPAAGKTFVYVDSTSKKLCSKDDAAAVNCTGGSGAPSTATYITQTPDATLSAEQALSTLSTGILKVTTTTGVLSIAIAGDFPTLNQSTTGSAATLTTPRAIYGNNFDGSAALTAIIASTFGGTGNGFTKFTGPLTTEKTFTLPNASATILTDNAVVTALQGGTAITDFSLSGTAHKVASAGFVNPAALKCVEVDTSGNLQIAGSNAACGSGGGMTNPMTTLGDVIYGGASGTATRLAGPTATNGVVQVLTSIPAAGAAVAPVWAPSGVPTNAQVGTTYTVVATDRASYVSFSNAGAIAVTLPQSGTTGFASNFVFLACDIGVGTATITPTTSTISYSTGSAYSSAQTTIALTTGQCAWIYSDNTNYFAVKFSSGGGSGTVTSVATTSPISGGTITATGTITCTTCVTSAASLTSGQLIAGAGSQASAVTNLTGDVTTSGSVATTLAAKYKTWTCETGIGDGLNAVTAGTYLQSFCWNKTGVTVTLSGVQCYTDNAGTSTLNAAGNTLGALLTGAVTCSSTIASGTQSANVALTNNDFIKFTWVADGTSKQSTFVVIGTY